MSIKKLFALFFIVINLSLSIMVSTALAVEKTPICDKCSTRLEAVQRGCTCPDCDNCIKAREKNRRMVQVQQERSRVAEAEQRRIAEQNEKIERDKRLEREEKELERQMFKRDKEEYRRNEVKSAVQGFAEDSFKKYAEYCFVEGTLVKIPGGFMPIEKIHSQDKIISCDMHTMTCIENEVTKVLKRKTSHLLRVKTESGEMKTTMDHPFFVVKNDGAGEFKSAKDLNLIEDQLLTSDGNLISIVEKDVIELNDPITVYNLSVSGGENLNNYFAGTDVLVHNCKLKRQAKEVVSDTLDTAEKIITDPRLATGGMIGGLAIAQATEMFGAGLAFNTAVGSWVVAASPGIIVPAGIVFAGAMVANAWMKKHGNEGGGSSDSVDKQNPYKTSNLEKTLEKIEKQKQEHIKKLEEYKKDPAKFDNLDYIKNAPDKEKVIEGRIKHLEKEIQNFDKMKERYIQENKI